MKSLFTVLLFWYLEGAYIKINTKTENNCTCYERQLTVWKKIAACHGLSYWHHCMMSLTVLACMGQNSGISGQTLNL